jgi:cysteinyl-tRNA synthetase
MRLYNSISKEVEEFKPISPENVKVYTCGPTVYFYQHIGNFRTFVASDLLQRALKYTGYKVKAIMNITDVGHLTGDNLGDADTGADRLEVAADREGKSARDIAQFYTDHFMKDYSKLNLLEPEKFTRATNYIKEMINLVQKLESKGFTYRISDGLYFDTAKFPEYGKLSGVKLEDLGAEGARIEPNPEKRNPTDFALWKFSPSDKMRWQEWDSPWGKGFPGWHIECSAMAMAELGESIDVHVGGEDHKMIHHPNEIAQSECATGKKFVNYWMHGAFLKVDGGRMGKSVGNAYILADLEARGFEPLSLRFFYMHAHYRTKLNFTWEALQNSQNSLKKLYALVESYKEDHEAPLSIDHLRTFEEAINNDLNMPTALATMWELIKSDVSEGTKLNTLIKFDEVLGLKIADHIGYEVPKEVENLARTRWEYRKQGIWDKADVLRRQIEQSGFVVDDSSDNYRIKRIK